MDLYLLKRLIVFSHIILNIPISSIYVYESTEEKKLVSKGEGVSSW